MGDSMQGAVSVCANMFVQDRCYPIIKSTPCFRRDATRGAHYLKSQKKQKKNGEVQAQHLTPLALFHEK